MKKVTISFVLILKAFLCFSQTPNNVILLLNFGQSNVVGRASGNPFSEVDPTPGTFWYKRSTNTLEPMIDGIGEGVSRATDRSINPMLGKRLKELTGKDVIIVPAGRGNTNIADWLKGDNISLYNYAKQLWLQAVSYCNANNITISNKYAHWLQGENDAGATETDGYYVMLNQLTNDVISDMGIEKMFATRIGYDPNYTSAANSEKIMKAQKILNFNHPNFIMASFAPPTFALANGKMSGDLVHYTLPGLNEVAEDVAQAIHYYRTTGTKISLPENVASLQSVTTGDINLTPDWSFDFAGNLNEANNNATMSPTHRNGLAPSLPVYTSDGVVIENKRGLVTSRPFSSNVYTLEIRFKMTSATASSTILGNGTGDNYDKLVIFHDTVTSALNVKLGTHANYFWWDLGNAVNMANFHTFKFTQHGGVLKFYLDGIQVGSGKTSVDTLTLSRLGVATEAPGSDMEGIVDFFKIKNTVEDFSALPIKFKSFKAINIK